MGSGEVVRDEVVGLERRAVLKVPGEPDKPVVVKIERKCDDD